MAAGRIPAEYPIPVKYAIAVLAACSAVAAVAITFGQEKKQMNVRKQNELKASAVIFQLLFVLFAVAVLSTFWGADQFTLEAFHLIIGFAALDFMKKSFVSYL